jgi:hypothetical protein
MSTATQKQSVDDMQFIAFRQTLARMRDFTQQLSDLDDQRDAYKIELLSGRRDPDPRFEYESKLSSDRLKRQLKSIEETIGVFMSIALSKTPDAPRYRELFEQAGMGHRLNGTIPVLARAQTLPPAPVIDAEQPDEQSQPNGKVLLAILVFAAAVALWQIVSMFGSY